MADNSKCVAKATVDCKTAATGKCSECVTAANILGDTGCITPSKALCTQDATSKKCSACTDGAA